jgi:hypothetical protein
MTMAYARQAIPTRAMAAKSDALVIRFTPEDRARLQRVAEAAYLDTSTWARQLLMRAVAEAEAATRPSSTPTSRRVRPPR